MKIDRAGYPFIAARWYRRLRSPWLADAAGRRRLRSWAASSRYFFRDPDRHVPQEPDLVVSPADGTGDGRRSGRRSLGAAGGVEAGDGLPLADGRPHQPIAGRGRITRIEYRPAGSCRPTRGSNDNELNEVWIERHGRPIVVRQVVGILARRIVCRVREGESVERGERIGLMKFGSRMDVFLPVDASLRVEVGQRVVGGETVLAELRSRPRAE